MITFRVKNGNVYVAKDGIEEFNHYLMTVDVIINIIKLFILTTWLHYKGFAYNRTCFFKILRDKS